MLAAASGRAVSRDDRADLSAATLAAFEALRIAVTIFDGNERLTYSNAHFNHLFRSMPPQDALLGQSYTDLVRMEIEGGEIAPAETLGDAEGFVARRFAQLHGGEYRPQDIRLADGRIIEIKTRRVAAGGWIALWTDVTESRALLARLTDAIELSADAFAFWNAKDQLVICNGCFAELHGHGAPADLEGVNFRDMMQAAADRKLFAIEGSHADWVTWRAETHESAAGAQTVTSARGVTYLIRERATRDGGRATVFTDVTDRRRVDAVLAEETQALSQMRQVLAKSQREAEQHATFLADMTKRMDAAQSGADAAKTTFLRTMSHEMKTPLNAIIGFSDMLRSTPERFGPEQVAEYAGLIHQGGHAMLRLVNHILDLTKIAAGRFELNRASVDVGLVLIAAKDAHETAAEKKGIALVLDDCGTGMMVDADQSALGSMVGHLVENAVTFTHNGGEVHLSLARAGRRVRIQVMDNGPGVETHELERIVRPFEQMPPQGGQPAQGAGLGLTLVKALAELHAGELNVQSALGDGFCATIELPAA
jgi:two-component system cell cycle sensor histidine kinase PleC